MPYVSMKQLLFPNFFFGKQPPHGGWRRFFGPLVDTKLTAWISPKSRSRHMSHFEAKRRPVKATNNHKTVFVTDSKKFYSMLLYLHKQQTRVISYNQRKISPNCWKYDLESITWRYCSFSWEISEFHQPTGTWWEPFCKPQASPTTQWWLVSNIQ